jgi:ADP-ribosylglycohydrolase
MNRNQELVNILLSVAVADAIGADVEFMANPTKRDFLAQVNGVHPLQVTDDTQMSLFHSRSAVEGLQVA